MNKGNQYYDSQLEAIRNYYEKLSKNKNEKITIKEAVVENVKVAIANLVNGARERDVTTIVTRWLTREPCPEKNHKKSK